MFKASGSAGATPTIRCVRRSATSSARSWKSSGRTVRQPFATCCKLFRPVAYTTVMTARSTVQEGVRHAGSRRTGFRLSGPADAGRDQAVLASGMVSGFFSSGAAVPILSNLIDAVGSQDGGAELLDTLEEMVRDKRRRLEQAEREKGIGKP